VDQQMRDKIEAVRQRLEQKKAAKFQGGPTVSYQGVSIPVGPPASPAPGDIWADGTGQVHFVPPSPDPPAHPVGCPCGKCVAPPPRAVTITNALLAPIEVRVELAEPVGLIARGVREYIKRAMEKAGGAIQRQLEEAAARAAAPGDRNFPGPPHGV
jgi:hypothetical protein